MNQRALESAIAMNDKIMSLRAELEPWRRMERQIGELREQGWFVQVREFPTMHYAEFAKTVTKERGYAIEMKLATHKGNGETLPEAVNAAYEKVVGDGS